MSLKTTDPFERAFFALMFDWNGTLINDARYYYYKVFLPILESFGADMSEYRTSSGYEELRSEYSKLGREAFVRMIARQQRLRIVVNEKEVALTWNRDVHPIVTARYGLGNPNMMPYATVILKYYSERRIPLGLVSGMPEKPLLKAIEQKGVRAYFDFIVGDISDKTEAYQEFIEYANCTDTSESVLSITDISKDIVEGKLAGMSVVGIDRGYGSRESLQDAKPMLVVRDLLELRKFRSIQKRQQIGRALRAR